MNAKRIEKFALKAPPVPDWYMAVPTRETYEQWVNGPGEEIVDKLKDEARSGGITHLARNERSIAEELRANVQKAYRDYAYRTDMVIRSAQAARVFAWPAYYASGVLKAIDEAYEAQCADTTEGSPGNALDPEEMRRKGKAFEKMHAVSRGLSSAIDDRSEERGCFNCHHGGGQGHRDTPYCQGCRHRDDATNAEQLYDNWTERGKA